jgi:predicted metal-dependent phosphotriesterase family hydrolase
VSRTDSGVIRTILKDISPESLGTGAILFHEHLSLNDAMMRHLGSNSTLQATASPNDLDPALQAQVRQSYKYTEDIELMADELRAAVKDGVSCIVDAGVAEMGRSLDALKRMAAQSGMYIVASGGYYVERTYPPEVASESEEHLVDKLVHSAGTERWGAMGEIGTSSRMTMDERKVLRIIGKVHGRTGLPIFTHTHTMGAAVKTVQMENVHLSKWMCSSL